MKDVKIDKISHSALRCYLDCPKLFYFRYYLKLDLPENPIHLHFGKSLHKALELIDHKKPEETFVQEFSDSKISNDDKTLYLDLRDKGQEMLKYYVSQKDLLFLEIDKKEQMLSFTNVKDPETGKQLKFNRISGVLDFVTKDEIIGDYKTSSHKYTQEEIDASTQPTIYYLLYYLKHGRLPKKFVYVVFLKKRKRDMIQVLETQRSMKDITYLINLCNDTFDRIENKEFERNHDEHKFCDCFKYEEMLKI